MWIAHILPVSITFQWNKNKTVQFLYSIHAAQKHIRKFCNHFHGVSHASVCVTHVSEKLDIKLFHSLQWNVILGNNNIWLPKNSKPRCIFVTWAFHLMHWEFCSYYLANEVQIVHKCYPMNQKNDVLPQMYYSYSD